MFQGFGRGIPSAMAKRTHPGRHTSVTLKGPSQLEGSLWSPSRFRIRLRTRSPDPELPTMHEPLAIAPERLVVTCFQITACHLCSLMMSTSSRRSCFCIDSSKDWTRGEPIRISRERQASAPKTREDGVTPVARLDVVTRVGVSSENILQDPLG
jgi:hypothetical protein